MGLLPSSTNISGINCSTIIKNRRQSVPARYLSPRSKLMSISRNNFSTLECSSPNSSQTVPFRYLLPVPKLVPISANNSMTSKCSGPIIEGSANPQAYLKLLRATPKTCPFNVEPNLGEFQAMSVPALVSIKKPKIIMYTLPDVPNNPSNQLFAQVEPSGRKGYKNMFNYDRFAQDGKVMNRARLTDNNPREEWKCLLCGDTKATKDSLIDHYEAHKLEREAAVDSTNADGKSIFQCPACQAELTSFNTYTLHVDRTHRPKEFFCDSCNTTCNNAYTMSLHVAQHHFPSDKLRCCLCKTFMTASKVMLRSHIYEEHEKDHKLLYCHECCKSFTSEAWFRDHKLFHLPESKQLHCEPCKKLFKDSRSLTLHNKQRHRIAPPLLAKHQCEVCQFTFPFKKNLIRHSRSYHTSNSYLCSVCGKTFGRQALLRIHVEIHDERKYVCSYCGKAFAMLRTLRLHVRIHTGEKPYKCTDCGWSFAQRSALTAHIRSQHTGEKRFACSKCDKRFVTKVP